jgi:eukaryotic-like serine/threonine-protein kinase
MGVVYKAHDIKLDRTVALKFLPQSVSPTADEKSRFMQEAKAAATLIIRTYALFTTYKSMRISSL